MQAVASLLLKPGKERSLLRRHPWVYAAAVAQVRGGPDGGPAPGALVAVRAADGRFLAWAAFSPASTLRARCWSFEEHERIDAAWLRRRVEQSLARRLPLQAETDALRLVFGEADGLPGLVVDRYDEFLVVQIQAAGIEHHREVLLDALCELAGCGNVFDRSDAALREREGLHAGGGVLRGRAPPSLVRIREHDTRFEVDLRRGHKTGFYLDQRDNRRLAGELVREFAQRRGRAPRVLNCFCYSGGFGICAAVAGASRVDSVDSSAEALKLGRANARLNGLGNAPEDAGASLHWHCADVFAQLRALRDCGERYDLIVLDPPKFATNQHQVERAARAYKDINLGALRLLEPGGWLLTFSCSGAIEPDLFQKIVAGAAADAGADCLLRRRLAAGADHPTRLAHPEGEYLKGLLLERA